MAYAPLSGARQSRLEMYQKGFVQPVFSTRSSVATYRPGFDSNDVNETDFEDDLSDAEEFSGRRSEDSMGKRSDTTLSSLEEVNTPENPTSNVMEAFNFQLESQYLPGKAVEGPSGPHLFRMSQDSPEVAQFYLSMSPPASPEEVRKPELFLPAAPRKEAISRTGSPSTEPLKSWTPRQVAEWMFSKGFERSIIDLFFRNDISGLTLIDLQYEDLKELGITSFGHRHRLWTDIRMLKDSASAPPQRAESFSSQEMETFRDASSKKCPSPESMDQEQGRSDSAGRRRRRAVRSDDIISPGESVSIVAIEQLLPKAHKCSKGENCSKWQRQQRKFARIATEFPLELAQIAESKGSPTESGVMGGSSVMVPSVVASSDLLGPSLPPLRLEENSLRELQQRDPQENVRHFLQFQHLDEEDSDEEPKSPPFEMFPRLTPANPQPPHTNLKSLPKLHIPTMSANDTFSPATAIPRRGTTPLTVTDRNFADDIFRLGSPASEMDVPLTAIHMTPIERDVSSSVPPNMRYGKGEVEQSSPYTRTQPQMNFDLPSFAPPQRLSSIKRSTSHAVNRQKKGLTMASLLEDPAATVIEDSPVVEDAPAPFGGDHQHAGWMKKRKTKMLRHEWQDNHFRLNGTRLAMHKDDKASEALECIDVENYAVACSSLNSSKINAAFKRLAVGSKKKESDPAAFSFQLLPSADKKGMMHAATGKTHHFAVKTATERIDWMRELLVAKALKQKDTSHSSF